MSNQVCEFESTSPFLHCSRDERWLILLKYFLRGWELKVGPATASPTRFIGPYWNKAAAGRPRGALTIAGECLNSQKDPISALALQPLPFICSIIRS